MNFVNEENSRQEFQVSVRLLAASVQQPVQLISLILWARAALPLRLFSR